MSQPAKKIEEDSLSLEDVMSSLEEDPPSEVTPVITSFQELQAVEEAYTEHPPTIIDEDEAPTFEQDSPDIPEENPEEWFNEPCPVDESPSEWALNLAARRKIPVEMLRLPYFGQIVQQRLWRITHDIPNLTNPLKEEANLPQSEQCESLLPGVTGE